MNFYERVQKAIDYIEDHLDGNIDLEDVAREAFMSPASMYRLFFALTGHSLKEYIRNRRLSIASEELLSTDATILEVAVKYGFSSNESFTRAFRKAAGNTPSAFRKSEMRFLFERMNVLEKYFEIQDKELLEKYPDIRVLKELPPFQVAYYCHHGREPESGAWAVISDWLKSSNLDPEKNRLRFFGFNNPCPTRGGEEYGYEVWVTVDEGVDIRDERIKTKTFAGGLYAVTTVKNGPEGLPDAWHRFTLWLKDSRYELGKHQWLEEHLGFDDDFNHIGHFDIYMPIVPRKNGTTSARNPAETWDSS